MKDNQSNDILVCSIPTWCLNMYFVHKAPNYLRWNLDDENNCYMNPLFRSGSRNSPERKKRFLGPDIVQDPITTHLYLKCAANRRMGMCYNYHSAPYIYKSDKLTLTGLKFPTKLIVAHGMSP